jgi:phage protein D
MATANRASPLNPSFEILINASSLPIEIEARVTSIVVDQDVGLPGMFSLELEGSDDPEKPTAWIDDSSLFEIGHTFEAKMGYFDDLDSLLIGEITGLEPGFRFDHAPMLTVRGYDRGHRLQRGRKTRTFVQQKDSDIASQIASEAGLTAQATDSTVTHDYVLQANQTDFEFLQERARRIQYEVFVQEKTLVFRPVANAESEILMLTMSNDLLEFYPRLSSMQLVSEVALRGWNPKEKKEILGKAKQGDEASTMGGQTSGAALVENAFDAAIGSVGDQPVASQAEADQVAKARFNDMSLTLVTGEGICQGRTDLRAGKVIKIEEIGTRFSGRYYVVNAVHQYSAQKGYLTYFTVKRSAV